jgi:hypothetical protein
MNSTIAFYDVLIDVTEHQMTAVCYCQLQLLLLCWHCLAGHVLLLHWLRNCYSDCSIDTHVF